MRTEAYLKRFRAELMASLGLALAACSTLEAGASGDGETGNGQTSNSTGPASATTTASPDPTTGASSSGGGTEDGSASTSAASSTGGESFGSETTSGSTSGTGEQTTGTGGETTGTGTSTGDGTSTAGETDGTSSTGDTEGTSSTGETGEEFTCEPPPPGMMQEYVCFPVPPGLQSCAECDETCAAGWSNQTLTMDPFCSYFPLEVQCGPDPNPANPGDCCYFVAHSGAILCEGRPFLIEGVARTAPAIRRGDWSADTHPSLAGLSAAARAALAEAWSADAAAEHASVAAFARFALQLLAVGAPSALVEGAQRAMADEISHARVCFALAGAYAGHPMGPGRLDMSRALGDEDLAAVAAATVLEGCVGETLAALAAQVAAERARDASVRAALRQIADDEARHARLAWRFVQWALTHGPGVRAAVSAAFAAALREPPQVQPWPAGAEPTAMRDHGRLPPEEQAGLFHDALHDVIAPAAEALLGRRPQPAVQACA